MAWSLRRGDLLQQRVWHGAPIAAASAPHEPDHLPWRAHSPESQPTRAFPIPLDRQFPSEPRLISPLNEGEYSMIFNCVEFCRTEGDGRKFYNAKRRC